MWLLLEKGADVSAKGWNVLTALHRAAESGRVAAVKQLLEKDAELDPMDNYGWTPLSWASANGHVAVAKLLLEKGADLDPMDNYFQKPLSRAAQTGQEAAVKLLIDEVAALESKHEVYTLMPLSYAMANGHEAVVKLLADKGAALEPKGSYSRFPIVSQYACDLLSVPATSSECERVLRSAKRLITPDQSRLAIDIIEATECLKAWWSRGYCQKL